MTRRLASNRIVAAAANGDHHRGQLPIAGEHRHRFEREDAEPDSNSHPRSRFRAGDLRWIHVPTEPAIYGSPIEIAVLHEADDERVMIH